MDIDEAPLPGGEPPNLRLLRILVTVLTVTMIAGFLVIVALIVIRFSGAPEVALPASITLPGGAKATAFTKGVGWYAVVTGDQRILIYDARSGDLRQEITIDAGN